MRTLATAVVVLMSVMALTAAASATSPVETASGLYNLAQAAVESKYTRCELPGMPTQDYVSHARPQAQLLDLLTALRRPGTAADRAAFRKNHSLLLTDARE